MCRSGGCCSEPVKFRHCMRITVAMGAIWPGKWGLWLMVVQVSFFEMWGVIPLLRLLQQSPIIWANDLIISNELRNTHHPDPHTDARTHTHTHSSGFTEQKDLGGKAEYPFIMLTEPTWNYRPLIATFQVVLNGKFIAQSFSAPLASAGLIGLDRTCMV